MLTFTAELFSVSYLLVYAKNKFQSNFRKLLKENKFNGKDISKIYIDKQHLESNSPCFHRTDDDEFVSFGKMYDVIDKDEQKEGTIFYCINDLKEDLLFSNLHNNQNENEGQATLKLFDIIKICQKLKLQQYIEVPYHKYIRNLCIDFGTNKRLFYLNFSSDIITPPPEISGTTFIPKHFFAK